MRRSEGLFLHFKTQETENQGLLDGGEVGPQRKLYYRELIARFGHHLALNWNMGEEIGPWQENPPTPPQRTPQRWRWRSTSTRPIPTIITSSSTTE